jgi:Spy/CpxP family protein refolding chaperone
MFPPRRHLQTGGAATFEQENIMANQTHWKSLIKPFAAASLIALAAATVAPAQAEPGGEPGGCRTGFGGPERHGPMGFGRFGGDQSGPMLRGLDLSESQRDQIFALRHAREPGQRELMKQLRASREALHTLARGDAFDAGKARTLADSHAKAVSEMALAHAEFEAKLRAVLTPEQRKTLDERRARHEQQREPGFRGGHGGGPRGGHRAG